MIDYELEDLHRQQEELRADEPANNDLGEVIEEA